MATFDIAYTKYVAPFEGGYVNDPDDYGGETYAGITRRYNPNWEGWTVVDFEKRARYNGIIPRGTMINGLSQMVINFYKALWNKHRLGEIENQKLANLIFDYIVNSGSAIKNIQEIIGVTQDGIIGPITIKAINSADPDSLFSKILNRRKTNYEKQVADNPTQQKFMKGWLARLEVFYAQIDGKDITIVLLVLAAIVIASRG